jgi:hypothetical protein
MIEIIKAVVKGEVDRHFLGRLQLEENLWVSGSYNRNEPHLSLCVSTCGGGAYSYFGNLLVSEFEVVFAVKTLWGIMRSRFDMVDHHFEFCDPAFPDNLIEFVKLSATRTNRCFTLQHKRGWKRRYREMMKGRELS